MGNFFCPDASHLATVARDFCPFPDYSTTPLFNILTDNSSLKLSEHYAAVQASLTASQQQDFTQTLRSTFGREGKVSNGGVGVVALSLAVLFDTVARQVKGQYESYQEPIPGLFLKDPRGTYPPPVHTISKYLRLVPHIANNPTRMRNETEKYLLELKQTAEIAVEEMYTAQHYEDITGVNVMTCYVIGKDMALHLQFIANKTIDLDNIESNRSDPKVIFNLNCDPKEASDRFVAELDSFADRTKEAFKNCDLSGDNRTVIENIAALEWFNYIFPPRRSADEIDETGDFDLKTNALGKWIL